jgi:hypothetical protein
MKKSLVLIACIVLLALPLLSCLPSNSSQSSNPVAYQSDITTLKDADKNLDDGIKKVDDRVTAWADKLTADETKIAILQAQPSANTYAKDQLYTQQQVNDAIAVAIKGLKDNQTWITGSTGTTTTTGGTTTTVSGVSVALDKNQVISTSTDTGNKDVTVTVTNSSGAGKTISLLISLTPLSPSAVDDAKLTTYTAKSTLSGFTTAQIGIKQMNPDVSTLIAKIYWVAPDFYLDNGTTKTIWLNFDVKSVDVVTWTLIVKAL